MSTPWADATRIVDTRRAEQERKVAAAAEVVAGVSPMVEQFRQAIMADSKAARTFRFIATGKVENESGVGQSKLTDKPMMLPNPYEPERGRLFKFSLDKPAWAVATVVEVQGDKITIGPGGGKLLLDPGFDDLIAAAERIPDWLPALLVQTLQEHDVAVPTD